MKSGAENRKKTIAAGALGMVALLCLGYAYHMLFGGSDAPARPAATPVTTAPAARPTNAARTNAPVTGGSNSTTAAIPGVAAVKVASASSSLDPTLDQTAMLRTENLVYAGAGRNIFSVTYTPPPPPIPKQTISPRPAQAPVYIAPQPTGPPPPPPINLKFFGTATRANGERQAFLLAGDDVYMASPGDIVARKYKIGIINQNSVQVTDLQNNNTQTLPLQMQ